jgi:hypothetical protein
MRLLVPPDRRDDGVDGGGCCCRFGIDADSFSVLFPVFFGVPFAGDLPLAAAAAAGVTEVFFMPVTNSDPGLRIVCQEKRSKSRVLATYLSSGFPIRGRAEQIALSLTTSPYVLIR